MCGQDVVAWAGFQKKSKATAVALSFLFVLGATGCGSTAVATQRKPVPAATQPEFTAPVVPQSAAAMTAQLKKAIKDFEEPLPSGIQWFKKTPDQLLQPNTTYADGAPEGVVAFYWLCSWEKSYLGAVDKSDMNAAASSLAQVGKWESLPFAESHFSDPDHAWKKAILAPAKQGDPTAMRSSFNSDCQEYTANNP